MFGENFFVMGSKRPSESKRAHRVAVCETPPPAVASPDYADAFQVARSPTDQRSAEQWARNGFERLPVVLRRSALLAHRWILGFGLGPWTSPNHVFGWQIVTSEPEVLHLEARSALVSGHMVWRLHPERLVMSTFLQYEMRRAAPVLWSVVGNIHRGATPYLLKLAAHDRSQPTGRPSPR